MELRLLRYFLAVAEELHVGRAAVRLRMTQQPLSVAIRRLETAIGAALFVREANRIRLTAAGHALVSDARDIIARADAAAERTRAIARGDVGALRIGYCSAAMHETIPAIASLLRRRHAGLSLDLAQLTNGEQLRRLDCGELDVAFVMRPVDERGRRIVDVVDDRLVVVMPIVHPLADRDAVRPHEVADEIGVAFAIESHGAFERIVVEAFAGCASQPQPTTFARDRASLVGLVAAGNGLAILNETAARAETRADVTFAPLATHVRLAYVAVWNDRATNEPLVRRFAEALDDVVASARARPAPLVSADGAFGVGRTRRTRVS